MKKFLFKKISALLIALAIFVGGTSILAISATLVFSNISLAAENTFQITQLIVEPSDVTAPSIPTNLVATAVSSSQINLTWTASTDNIAVTGYKIYRDGVHIATSTVTNYSNTSLSPDTTYVYTITAIDASFNESVASASASATTFAAPLGPSGGLLPIRLIDFNVYAGTNSLDLNFDTNFPVITTIQWGQTADYELGSLASEIYSTEHNILLNDLSPGTLYYFKLILVDGRGRVAIVDNQQARTLSPEDLLVSNVANLRVIGGPERITLSWQNPPTNFDQIRIVRSDKFFPRDPFDGEIVFEGRAEEFVDTDFDPEKDRKDGKIFYYTVFTENAGRFSSGVIVSASLLSPGERSKVKDFFAGIVELSKDLIHPLLEKFSLIDIDFIQDNEKLSVIDDTVEIKGDRTLKVSIAYEKVPEILKTIAMTMYDPDDSSKTFSFLLRINEEKTAYEALIAPLGRGGRYTFGLAILDHKNQGLKKLAGLIVAAVPSVSVDGAGNLSDTMRNIFYGLSAVLILFGLAVMLGFFDRRKNGGRDGEVAAVVNAENFQKNVS